MPFRNTWGQPSYLTALIGVSCSLVDSASYFHINKYKKSDCSQAAFRGFYFTAFGKDGSREPVMVMTPTKLSFPVPQKSPALPQSPLCAGHLGKVRLACHLSHRRDPPPVPAQSLLSIHCFASSPVRQTSPPCVTLLSTETHFSTPSSLYFIPVP